MRYISAFLAFCLSFSAAADELNFGQMREKLVGQNVRITSRLMLGKVEDWYPAQRRADGSVAYSVAERLPAEYKGAKATVISVELFDKPVAKTDPFGKQIDYSRIKDPRVEILVRFDDGKEAVTTAYSHDFNGDALQLVAEAEKWRADIESILAKLNGKSVYIPMYQRVYSTAIPFDDMLKIVPSALPLSFNDVPRATPLRVVETKYLDGYNRALIKIALPNGSEGIMVGNTDHFYLKRQYKPSDLDRLGFHAELTMKKFTPREITAIKKVEFFPGMSKRALYWSVGLPDRENDYGRGGKQLVFPTGLIVYVKNDQVTSYQRF